VARSVGRVEGDRLGVMARLLADVGMTAQAKEEVLPDCRLAVGVGHGIEHERQATAGDAGQNDMAEHGEQRRAEDERSEPPDTAGGDPGR